MQDAMTIVITAIAILFAAAAIVDFAAMLITAWHDAGVKAQPQVELEPAAQEQAIAPQVEVTPDPWLQPAEEQAIALPLPQMNNVKPLLLLPAALEVVQPENVIDYSQFSIRQLKRMASGKVKGYSNLTKPQLIAALAAA